MKRISTLLFALLAFSCSSLYSNNITWSTPPTTLSGSGLNASDPQITVDPSGNSVAAWVENNLVKASSKLVSGSWSSAVTLSATGASAPRIVVDNNGNATAIWLENGVVKAASKPFNSSWSVSTALSNTGAASPTLCVDNAGDVISGWTRSGNVETSTKLFGGSWSRTTITSTSAAMPNIAVGGSGSNTRAVLTWEGTSGGFNVIFSSTKLLSGNWSTAQVISETTHNAAQPYVAVDANGNSTAVWYSYDLVNSNFANVTVKSSTRSAATGTWGAVTALSSSGIRNPASLIARIAYDSIGNAIALWNISFDDETFNVESAVKPVNGPWSAPVDLVTSNLYAYALDLSVTTFGDVLGTYMFYNGGALLIQAVESDVNGFLNNVWSVPLTISLGNENGYPRIDASLSGNTIHTTALWLTSNGTNNSVVAVTGSKTLVLPPTSLAVTQNTHNFGVFTEYYNTLSWTASTDPNVAGYLIFRNGVFLAQVGAGTTQFVDDNRVQNGSVTYGVTAIDAQQNQSVTVSISFP